MDARTIKDIIEELNEADLKRLSNFIKNDFLRSTHQFFTNTQIIKLQQFADNLVKNANEFIKNEQSKRETIRSIILALNEIQGPPTNPHNIEHIQKALQQLGSRYQSLFDPTQQNQLLQSSVTKESVPTKLNSSLFINPVEFEKAAIHAHQRFLSTPFTCPNPDRPYERAICLLANNTILQDVSVDFINEDGSINLEKVGQAYKSPVKKVVYRPNHELLHSLRQAAMVPKIREYYDRNTPGVYDRMQPKNLERLQLMLLFSVAGRQDETGFGDSLEAKEKFYLKYRADSAKAFLEYAKSYPGLYGPDEEEKLYQDALIVELMGNPTFPEYKYIYEGNYEIVKMIREKEYSLPRRAPTELNEFLPSKVYLEFMNTAHSLDLLRVYSPYSEGSDNSRKNIEKFIGTTLRYLNDKNSLTEANIMNCIKDTISMLQYSRKMLDESGEKTTTMVELDNKKIEEILSDPLLAAEIKSIVNKPTKLNSYEIDDAKMRISQLLADRILQQGSYDYTIKRFNHCHYKSNSNLDKDRDFQRDVTSGMSMLNAVQRPQFSAEGKLPTQAVPPITTTNTAAISIILESSQSQNEIKNIIKKNLKEFNITQAGDWETLNEKLSIEVGISNHSKSQAITIKNYQIELKNEELIILDKNNQYAVVTDQAIRETLFNQILTNIPDQYKLETTKISAAPPPPPPPIAPTALPATPPPQPTAPLPPAAPPQPAAVTSIDYKTYVENMRTLINDPHFLQGKAVHIKTGKLGEFFLPDARPSVIQKIKKVLDKYKNHNQDSLGIWKAISLEIQEAVVKVLTKIPNKEKTHNSDEETQKFMNKAKDINSFNKYCEDINKNQKKPKPL